MLDRLSRWIVAAAMLLAVVAGGNSLASAGEMLTDPTRPPDAAAGRTGPSVKKNLPWRLSATIIGPQRRIAVINAQAVRIGQTIDGATLVAVEPGSALLLQGDRAMQLKLNATTVKRTTSQTP